MYKNAVCSSRLNQVICRLADHLVQTGRADSVIKNNAEKANYYASKTLRKVQRKVGFPDRIR